MSFKESARSTNVCSESCSMRYLLHASATCSLHTGLAQIPKILYIPPIIIAFGVGRHYDMRAIAAFSSLWLHREVVPVSKMDAAKEKRPSR